MGCFLYDKDLCQERVKRERGLQGSFFVMQRLCKAHNYPTGNYLLKVNNRNTRTTCETCSELTIKTPGRRHWL